MITLKAEARDIATKLDGLRKAGRIPAVFYGKKEPSTPISINTVDFLKVWKQAGESSVVVLETPDGEKESLIHDIDFDPVNGTPRHADFYVFEKGHKVEVEVPLEFEGVAPAIKDLGGSLVKVVHAVRVEAMPKDLPHDIKIDITPLVDFSSQILAQDIVMPHGVTLLEKPEEVIALVSAPREEKEEEAAPVDLESIEVEKKGKDEVPEEGASESTEKAE
ncbi:MAG: 50S ribosomal protein L25 [Minisyncoccota bacterium]